MPSGTPSLGNSCTAPPGSASSGAGCPAAAYVTVPSRGSTMPKIAVTITGFARMLTIVFARSSTSEGEFGLSAAARNAWRTSPITIAARSPWPATSPIENAMRPSGRRNASYQSPPTIASSRAGQIRCVEREPVVDRQPLGQQRALQRVGDVVLARVHLRGVDRDRDAQRELVPQLEPELVGGVAARRRRRRACSRAAGRGRSSGKSSRAVVDAAGARERRADLALVDLDGEAVGELGDDEPADRGERLRVVERGGQLAARRDQQSQRRGQTSLFDRAHRPSERRTRPSR